jgi:hypothetical protein
VAALAARGKNSPYETIAPYGEMKPMYHGRFAS